MSHRTSFDPSKLNNILGNGLISRPIGVQVDRELELFRRSGTVYSALRHKQYGMDNIKNEAYGAIEFLIDPSRVADKTTWLPQNSSLDRYQSLEEIKEDHRQKGLHFRQLNSVLPKASLMKNYEGNSGYVEAQTHAPILPSDISAIRIGSSQVSPDQLFKKHGDSLLAFIRTALSKNIKVIGDFSPKFLEAAESASININKGLSEGISKSASKPVEAIGEVAHKTVKATEGYPVDKQSVRGNPNLFAGNNLNPEIKKILDFAIKPDAEINKILGQPEITALDKLQDKSLIHKKLLEKINSLLPKGLESQFGINLNNSQLLGSGSFSSVVGTTDSRNLSYKVLEGKSIPTPIRMKINDGILKEPPEVSILKKLSSTGIVP